jgi:inosose dehydratase
VGHPAGVTSIKALHYLTSASMATAIGDIEAAGYAGVELFVEIAERHGLTPTYHPHMGTLVETPDDVRRVFARTRIGFCPDTGHLILGGGDPPALVREYAGRIPHVHLKDVTADGTFVPLGHGVLDLDGVLEALREQDYDGWLMVELDHWDDPAAGAAASYARLTR